MDGISDRGTKISLCECQVEKIKNAVGPVDKAMAILQTAFRAQDLKAAILEEGLAAGPTRRRIEDLLLSENDFLPEGSPASGTMAGDGGQVGDDMGGGDIDDDMGGGDMGGGDMGGGDMGGGDMGGGDMGGGNMGGDDMGGAGVDFLPPLPPEEEE